MQIINMSTKRHDPVLDTALAGIPLAFRSRIIGSFLDLKKNCSEERYEAAGLAVGKFCETVLRHLQNEVTGTNIPFNRKIGNYADECRKLVQSPNGSASESERVILPRALVFLYTMRNKRGIGHVGGDIDANQIDIAVMARTADWVICELIRIHHGLSLEEGQDLVDSLSIRKLPAIWEVAGKKRILKAGVKARDQVLLLLYSSVESAVLVEDLCDWIEYSNPSVFKSNILRNLHKSRFVEYDKDTGVVTLSPKGAAHVEDSLLRP